MGYAGNGNGLTSSPSANILPLLPNLIASATLSSTSQTRSSCSPALNFSETKSGTGTLVQSLTPTPDILVTSDKSCLHDDDDPIGGNVIFKIFVL